MEKISDAQFKALLGTEYSTLTVSAEGVVVGPLGSEGQTIVRFESLDPADVDTVRAVFALFIATHVTKAADVASAERAKQSAQFIRAALDSGRLSDAERGSAKAMLAKLLDVSADAISAEEQRAVAVATAEVEVIK